MLDRSAGEVVGAPLHAVVHAAECDESACALSSSLAVGGVRAGAADDFVRAGGEVFPAEFSFTPFGDRGPMAGAVLVFRDISERRAVEKVQDQFLSIVSHELRTPLTSVRGSLGLLGSGVAGELSSKASRMVDIAVDDTDRLIRPINDILDTERMAASEVTSRWTAGRSKRPTWSRGGAGRRVDGERRPGRGRDRLRRRTGVGRPRSHRPGADEPDPQRGDVLGARPRRRRERHPDGPEVRFSVEDSGRGIPADQLTLIFDRFRQVDASDARDRGGAGLGLAITKGIVEQHGGRIWVESTEGVGSTFSFQIPRSR